MSAEELFQHITTLIELPLPQINKKNVENIFGVKMKRLMPHSKSWVFYSKEKWNIEINTQKKENVFSYDVVW